MQNGFHTIDFITLLLRVCLRLCDAMCDVVTLNRNHSQDAILLRLRVTQNVLKLPVFFLPLYSVSGRTGKKCLSVSPETE